MKMLLDYLAIAAFAAAYYWRDIYFATVVLIVALFIQFGLTWLLTRQLPKMLLAGALLALVMGGITLALRDPTFIKLKPTVLYGVFALALIASQFIGDKPIIQRLLAANLALPDSVWRRLNLMWAGFFVFSGALNLYVAFSFAEQVWVNFKLFGMLGVTLVFVLAQGIYLSRYLQTPPADEAHSR